MKNSRSGNTLYVFEPREAGMPENDRLAGTVSYALQGIAVRRPRSYRLPVKAEEGSRLLFVIDLGRSGVNLAYEKMLRAIRMSGDVFAGCTAALIVDSGNEFYSKETAGELALALSQAGCTLIGHSLVEGTSSLHNFRVRAANFGCSLEEAYRESARDLVDRLLSFQPTQGSSGRDAVLTVLHANKHRTSNSHALWQMVKEPLSGLSVEISEIGLRNGAVQDCSGCPYKMCLHYGEKESCFYGGVMVDSVYPAVKRADALLLICPNYNDALSANLASFINRLTALYRTQDFTDKAVFAIVVSGYSGSDLVAAQIVRALNMNKGFYLPAGFCLTETANDPGEILGVPGIREKAAAFSAVIRSTLLHSRERK